MTLLACSTVILPRQEMADTAMQVCQPCTQQRRSCHEDLAEAVPARCKAISPHSELDVRGPSSCSSQPCHSGPAQCQPRCRRTR